MLPWTLDKTLMDRWWSLEGTTRIRNLEWINKISFLFYFFFSCWWRFWFKLLWTLSVPRRYTLLIYVAHLFFITHSRTFLLYIFQVKRGLRLYGLKDFFLHFSGVYTGPPLRSPNPLHYRWSSYLPHGSFFVCFCERQETIIIKPNQQQLKRE